MEYRLTINSDQVKAIRKALDLLMKLKLGMYGQIPYALIGEPGEDFCKKRDAAMPHLNRAFCAMSGTDPYKWSKDSEWRTLFEIDQALLYGGMKAEEPKATGIRDMEPDKELLELIGKEGTHETAGDEI